MYGNLSTDALLSLIYLDPNYQYSNYLKSNYQNKNNIEKLMSDMSKANNFLWLPQDNIY